LRSQTRAKAERTLAEYLWDKQHRARCGQVVPGAHVFLFCTEAMAWRHAEAIENRNSEAAAAILRNRFRMRTLHAFRTLSEGAVVAGLLVRVADDGRIAARKLVWLSSANEVRETANLPRAGDILPAEDFHLALTDLEGSVPAAAAATFVLDTPEKLRTLFASQAGGDRP
jgi:hypothetical protein